MTEHITTYSVKQASQLVAIGVSTVRKYSLLLESLGYRISRNEQNARIFYDADILALRRLKEGSAASRTLDSVAREIVTANLETAVIKGNPPAPNDAQAIRQLQTVVEMLVDKVDELLNEQEETRRAFQMALRKMEGSQAEHAATIEAEAEVKTVGWWRRFRK